MSIVERFENINNSICISVQLHPLLISAIKDYKLTIDIVTVTYSVLFNAIVLIALPYLHNGLRFHVHLRQMIYVKWLFYVCYRCSVDLSTVLSYILPFDSFSKVFAVPMNLLPLSVIEIVSAAIVCGAIANLIFERQLATILINCYENWISYTFVTAAIVSVAALSAGFTCLVLLVDDGFIYVIPFILVLISIMVIAVTYIVRKNLKLYAIYVTSQNQMTLSQRYQLSENLRIIKFMRVLLITEVICNFSNLTAFFVYFISEDFWFKILVHYIWQWTALSFASVVMAIFVSNGALPTVTQLYKSLGRNRVKTMTPEPSSIKSTMGEQMVFQSHQEADVYFIQLAQSWK